jgi:hypothetical protein
MQIVQKNIIKCFRDEIFLFAEMPGYCPSWPVKADANHCPAGFTQYLYVSKNLRL